MEAEQYQDVRLNWNGCRRERDLKVIAHHEPRRAGRQERHGHQPAAPLRAAPDARVLLIEADVRRRRSAAMLGLHGLARTRSRAESSATRRSALQEVAQRFDPLSSARDPAGSPDTRRERTAAIAASEPLLNEAREQYDYVMVDTPPLGPVSDCALLARRVDGLLLVVAAHKTPRKMLEASLNRWTPRRFWASCSTGTTVRSSATTTRTTAGTSRARAKARSVAHAVAASAGPSDSSCSGYRHHDSGSAISRAWRLHAASLTSSVARRRRRLERAAALHAALRAVDSDGGRPRRAGARRGPLRHNRISASRILVLGTGPLAVMLIEEFEAISAGAHHRRRRRRRAERFVAEGAVARAAQPARGNRRRRAPIASWSPSRTGATICRWSRCSSRASAASSSRTRSSSTSG